MIYTTFLSLRTDRLTISARMSIAIVGLNSVFVFCICGALVRRPNHARIRILSSCAGHTDSDCVHNFSRAHLSCLLPQY